MNSRNASREGIRRIEDDAVRVGKFRGAGQEILGYILSGVADPPCRGVEFHRLPRPDAPLSEQPAFDPHPFFPVLRGYPIVGQQVENDIVVVARIKGDVPLTGMISAIRRA